MDRIDVTNSAFWSHLNRLGKCNLNLQLPTCSFRSTVDLWGAHLVDQNLLIPNAGLSLRTTEFANVFTNESPLRLLFNSDHRRFGFTLSPIEEPGCKRARFFIKAFTVDTDKPLGEILSVEEPRLCPCCVDAAHFRIQRLAQNPLTRILADSIERDLSLIISSGNDDGRLTFLHTPISLRKEGASLISIGENQRLCIDVRHLHAMHSGQQEIDGETYQSLTLLNSHGGINCSLSLPSSKVGNIWNQIFNDYDHYYQPSRSNPNW